MAAWALVVAARRGGNLNLNPNPNPNQANELWRAAGASCRCHTYRVIPTGARTGYIEALENAIPILGADFAYSRRPHT